MTKVNEPDPLCPVRHEAASYAAEEGRQKSQLKWRIITWGLAAVALVGVSMFALSYMSNKVSAIVEAVTPDTPCMFSSEKDCGKWAHPTQWFGWSDDDSEEAEVIRITPPAATANETVVTEVADDTAAECIKKRSWFNPMGLYKRCAD